MEDWRHVFHAAVTTLLFIGVLSVVLIIIRIGMHYLAGAQEELTHFNDSVTAAKQGEYNDAEVEGSEVIFAMSQNSDRTVRHYYTTLEVLHSVDFSAVPEEKRLGAENVFEFLIRITNAEDVNNAGLSFDAVFKEVYVPGAAASDKFFVNPDGVFFAHQFTGPGSMPSVMFVQEEL